MNITEKLKDHFPLAIVLKNDGPSQQHSKTKNLDKRSYNGENIKVLYHRLLSINWDEIENCNDPNETYQQFFNSTALRCRSFSEKSIEKKHLCHHEKSYYYFCKSNIFVINLIVGFRKMIKL